MVQISLLMVEDLEVEVEVATVVVHLEETVAQVA
jgi:hypothetical protein